MVVHMASGCQPPESFFLIRVFANRLYKSIFKQSLLFSVPSSRVYVHVLLGAFYCVAVTTLMNTCRMPLFIFIYYTIAYKFYFD